MAVLIKDMQMPRECLECPLAFRIPLVERVCDIDEFVIDGHIATPELRRAKGYDCKLIELPFEVSVGEAGGEE